MDELARIVSADIDRDLANNFHFYCSLHSGAVAVFVLFGVAATTMDYLTNFDVKINLSSTFEPSVRPK